MLEKAQVKYLNLPYTHWSCGNSVFFKRYIKTNSLGEIMIGLGNINNVNAG